MRRFSYFDQQAVAERLIREGARDVGLPPHPGKATHGLGFKHGIVMGRCKIMLSQFLRLTHRALQSNT